MSFYGFTPYVSVAEKKAKADKQRQKLEKKGEILEPILIEGRVIASTWWGKSWNENLENYADYANRIARGKSYVKNHAVLDLKIKKGCVDALVQGSSSKPYLVSIEIDVLSDEGKQQVIALCDHRIDSIEQLLSGKFPKELEVLFKERKCGLFPSPKEIHFDCSCPDYASMCKHVAAVLYGIGARLDQNPLLFFELRNVDCQDLIKRSVESKLNNMLKNAGKQSRRTIAEKDAHDLFGL